MHARIASASPQITRGIGEAIGKIAEGPLAIMLVGDYGTGKTTFVQGLAKGLDISGPVRSPSYNILKRYTDGRVMLVHADLYRTQSEPDIEELGIMDIVGAKGILAVEWPGRYLPPSKDMPTVNINFSYIAGRNKASDDEETRRNLEIFAPDDVPAMIREVLRALTTR